MDISTRLYSEILLITQPIPATAMPHRKTNLMAFFAFGFIPLAVTRCNLARTIPRLQQTAGVVSKSEDRRKPCDVPSAVFGRIGFSLSMAPASHQNVFQQLIRQFDAIHPYNAAQVMRLRGQPDLLALDRSWTETMTDLGVGPVRVVAKRFEDLTPAEPMPDVKMLDPLTGDLAEQLTRGMNRPFNPSGLDPFRPFILKHDQESYWAGIVYQHVVADSVSIRMLLREWFLRMFDPSMARARARSSRTRILESIRPGTGCAVGWQRVARHDCAVRADETCTTNRMPDRFCRNRHSSFGSSPSRRTGE